jgi:hypothetical protein
LVRHGDDDFRPVWVCGVAGCGNTVTAALLHERFEVAGFADESALYAPSGSPFAIRSSRTFDTVAAFQAAMMMAPGLTPAELRQALAVQYRRETELPKSGRVIIDKAPNTHMLRAAMLHAAYPSGRFVLVFRDPLGHIEGMRRKWDLFGKATLDEVCSFWRNLHEQFLIDIHPFRSQVIGFTYEEFVADAESCCERMRWFLELEPRADRKRREDRTNRPGYALRNVVDGTVRIIGNANAEAIDRLSMADRKSIADALMPLYERMRREFAWQ